MKRWYDLAEQRASVNRALGNLIRAYEMASKQKAEIALVITLNGRGSIRISADLTKTEAIAIIRKYADNLEAKEGAFGDGKF